MLGASPLSSFSEGTDAAQICDRLYDDLKKSLVASYPWSWSFKKGLERGKHAGDRSEWFGRFPPDGGKICIFHGEPNPMQVANDFEWIGENYA